MYKVMGFGYDTEKDKEIIKYIRSQPHIGSYIKDLVRKDMNKQDIDKIIEEKIKKYLEGIEIKNKEVPEIDTSSIMEICDM